MIIERANFLDALYMTVISISTVGYEEVFDLSPAGVGFTIFVIISGLGIFFYAAVFIGETIIENRLRKILGRRKMKSIEKMNKHIIIVGFGRMGEQVTRELSQKKVDFVIIEKDQDRFARAEEMGFDVMLADATVEDFLEVAGVQRAKTLISLLPTDAENLFTVLTARDLNSDIFIITRAVEMINEKKLIKIGANQVVTPHRLTSQRIVNSVLKPNVVNLIDLVTQSKDLSLSLEEVRISEDSPLLGKTIRQSGIRQQYDAMVVAVQREERLLFNPSPDLTILQGDLLILIGHKEDLLKVT
jgi:voltage-gated potassium channel